MNISPDTQLDDLVGKYPFLESFLAHYHANFALLKNKSTRTILGKSVTLKRLALTCRVDLDALMEALAAHIRGACGDPVQVVQSKADHQQQSNARMQIIKDAVLAAQNKKDTDGAHARLAAIESDIEAHEIAAVEQSLIEQGVAVEEIRHVYEQHGDALGRLVKTAKQVEVMPGHPLNTYLRENERLSALICSLEMQLHAPKDADGKSFFKDMGDALAQIHGVETHYVRIESQLLPILERHGLTKAISSIWEEHEEVLSLLRRLEELHQDLERQAVVEAAPQLCRAVCNMIFKENRILFPLALNALTAAEWIAVRSGEDQVGYSFGAPENDWSEHKASLSNFHGETSRLMAPKEGGEHWPLEQVLMPQLDLMLNHLPMDLTFIDEHDELRYFNKNPDRVFARGDSAIGRKVQQCHPSKSLHLVNRILSEFRWGKKKSAEFWFEFRQKTIHVRYLAVRDAQGAYRGCLEIAQDVTALRQIQGERRLPQWNE